MNQIKFNDDSNRKGLAIAALISGVLAFILCCAFINIPIAVISIILAVVSLVKKRGGAGMATTGLVLSGISLLVGIWMLVTLPIGLIMNVIKHADEIQKNGSNIAMEYQEEGTLPEWIREYSESDPDTVKALMDAFVQVYGEEAEKTSN